MTSPISYVVSADTEDDRQCREVSECLELLSKEGGPHELTDKEVLMMLEGGHIPAYKLESVLDNPVRGVAIRRHVIATEAAAGPVLQKLPYLHYDYSLVMGACCENVIGEQAYLASRQIIRTSCTVIIRNFEHVPLVVVINSVS